jgi:flavin-dependent dehydrogenase
VKFSGQPLVVGAGPVGKAAALFLAREGIAASRSSFGSNLSFKKMKKEAHREHD